MADVDVKKEFQERFAQLPKIVQDAITSAQISEGLRKLSEQNKLHLDQWDKLEDEVMLALLGIEDTANLPQNIAKNVGVSDEVGLALAQQISENVFLPIRGQLERELGSPQAKEEEKSDVDMVRSQILNEKNVAPAESVPQTAAATQAPDATAPTRPAAPAPAPTPVVPGTPPAPPPEAKAVREPLSSTYIANNPSTARKNIEGDPYREPAA